MPSTRQLCCVASKSVRAFWMPCSRTVSASCRSARERELQRPDHHGEDTERLHACRLRIVWCHAGGDVVDDGQHAVGLVAQVQRPISSSRAADGQPLSGLSRCCTERYLRTYCSTRAAGRQRAQALALFAELVGDRGSDEVFLREVAVEGAVGQSRVRHEGGDPRASMPSRLNRRPAVSMIRRRGLLVLLQRTAPHAPTREGHRPRDRILWSDRNHMLGPLAIYQHPVYGSTIVIQ